MPSKHAAGGCGCCALDCDDCDAVTYFTIEIDDPVCAGTGDPDPGFCSRNNGTYIFRTVGTPIGDCSWLVAPLATGSCNSEFELIYIGYGTDSLGNAPCGQPTPAMHAIIEFVAVGGQVQVSVYLQYAYIRESASSPGDTDSATYLYTFRDTFDTCADAIGATLPHVDTDVSICEGSDPGDFCVVESATVTIG